MKIAEKYEESKHVAIIFNGLKYIFISRLDSKSLTEKILSYSKGKGINVMAIYDEVDKEVLFKIIKAVNNLNEGKEINLEKLLENGELN